MIDASSIRRGSLFVHNPSKTVFFVVDCQFRHDLAPEGVIIATLNVNFLFDDPCAIWIMWNDDVTVIY